MFTRMRSLVNIVIRAQKGHIWGRNLLKKSLNEVKNPTKAFEKLPYKNQSNGSLYFDEPIFILSAGWRSGSTLLQRMLLKDPELIMWGEPYHRSNIIDNMIAQLTSLQGDWPPKDYYLSKGENDQSEEWIANTWPTLKYLREAHLAYWNNLFETPTKNFGKSKWGIKEVRWGAKHVEYMKWLYPNAKFIYLSRNPLNAYASFYYYPRAAFLNWPAEPIFTAKDFANMWLKLVREFNELENNGTGILVRYEDLKDKGTQEKLEQYLGIRINNSSKLSKLVSPGVKTENNSAKTKNHLPKIEKFLLKFFLNNKHKKFGY